MKKLENNDFKCLNQGNSPFAVNDVYSRAAQLGRTGRTSQYWNRRNPNEVRKTKR